MTNNEENILETISNPEIVIGIVGPVGADINCITEYLTDELKNVDYSSEVIHITQTMNSVLGIDEENFSSFDSRYHTLIERADEFCQRAKNNAALAGLAIGQIRRLRAQKSGEEKKPALGTAYIIRQLKRPKEIELLRKTYGRKFIQVSVYLEKEDRIKKISDSIKHFDSTPVDEQEALKDAIDLVERDYKEQDNKYGQRVEDIFHLGDVFLIGQKSKETRSTVHRFIRALFGDNGVSPNKSEYGLYAAAGASLRSIDLSRQIGAAIFSPEGEIITQGCNEVPKPFGGTYWDDDTGQKYRDFERGRDENQHRKLSIVHDLLQRMGDLGFISKKLIGRGDVSQQVKALVDEEKIRDSNVMKIIEFGRMIHAEMSAVMDAARLGKSVSGATLFCTTFPCHLCAKHIVAAGISRVVFLEPYPKSYSKELHEDSITFSKNQAQKKVLFEPFIGISPRRYRDIFEKGKRKDGEGNAIEWYEVEPVPRIEDRGDSYIAIEEHSIKAALQFLSEAKKFR